VLVYLGFYIAAPWIAAFFEEPLYADLIRVSVLSFLLRPFLVMRNAWLNREMNFKSRSIVDVGTGLFTGAASTAMAFAGMGVWSLTLSGLFAGLLKNFWLARITPLRLQVNLDVATMRKHSAYGAKIVANDFVTYLRSEAKNLILSKIAGPAFLGLFNKAESLSRLPNQLLMAPTMEPLFRAMSKTQDNLDQSKYLFYRTITLLMVYTTPVYVLLWWIAEPFIGVVYGAKWIEAGAAMSILCAAGIFLNVIFPCGVVLAAQNRLGREMLAQAVNLVVVVGACVFGSKWGLEGVAWGIVLAQVSLAVHFYWLAQRALRTRMRDLILAVAPGIALSALLFGVLTLIDLALHSDGPVHPAVYVVVMSAGGGLVYVVAFLFIPIASLRSEASRWRQKLAEGVSLITRRFS
jgi:teichuronic acid exporter